jgi:hypothetical protein
MRHRLCRFSLSLVLLLSLPSCAPGPKLVSDTGVAKEGRGAFQVNVAPPLVLAATGYFRVDVPSDVNISPSGGFRYAVYAERGDAPLRRQTHVIVSDVDRYNWRWEKESWALPESLGYEKRRAGGRDWTVQILPMVGEKDWFNALWTANNRQTPAFWLAKRWSATPDDDLRVVAEYREEAPPCLAEPLAAIVEAARHDKNAPGIRGRELARPCAREIAEFSLRADAAMDFERTGIKAEGAKNPELARPAMRPDMARLVGRVEKISRGGGLDERN